MYLLSIIKEIMGSVKKKHKFILLLLLLILSYLFEITYELLDDRLTLIAANNNAVVTYGDRLDDAEARLLSIENQRDQIVLRSSFNAYIERQDDEYHAQMLFNEEIDKSNSELVGKVYMLEQLALIEQDCNYKKVAK
jgi:hypothetical protein